MEERHQKLAQVLKKNDTWKWLGPGNLLGDKTLTQYSGLKIFIRYILDNRTAILDKRKDKGVGFATTGDNPLCRHFLDYLQKKAEETKNKKDKEQLTWMINRTEAMLQMRDPSLGQMNDGILFAYANTFFALGEQAQPRIDVNENSIVGLLEDGFVKSRQGDPSLGKTIDGIERGKVPTGAIQTAPVLPAAPAAPAVPATPVVPATSASVTGKETLTTKTSTTTKIPGEKPAEEVPKSEEATPPEGIGSETLFGPLKPKPKPKPKPEPEPKLKPKPEPKPELKKASILTQKRAEKKALETTKFKQPIISTGEGTRKKQPKKQPVQKTKQEKGKSERKKEQPAQQPATQPTEELAKQSAERGQAPLSGGWKIAKRTGRIVAGSVAGGGVIGWAATSASEAKAATLAFINFLF